jgi:predicted TIM-barrel fold metal-dependent hydrolase
MSKSPQSRVRSGKKAAAVLPPRRIDIHNHVRPEDPGGDKLVGLMDGSDVEMALVMGAPGHPNEAVMQAVAKHPGRLVPGAYVDPREGTKALDEVARHHSLGVRVVKLFPNLGYYPDDDAFVPFFAKIADLGMAVLSHCGWLAPEAGVSAAYHSHPGRFEKPIRRHPRTPFILAHMGGIAGFLETIMLTTRTPNTYADVSPGQGTWVLEHAGPMAASIPPEKLLWGVDSYNIAAMLDRHGKALEAAGFGPHFEKIFHDNARGILERIGAIGQR